MRKRLAQVLERDDEDEPMDTVVRRFWARTKSPLATKTSASAQGTLREHANGVVHEHANKGAREHATVVDLARARWARAHATSLL
jgi:hypothetical protein